MSSESLNLSPSLRDYMHSVSLREPDVLRQLRTETAGNPHATMQISPEQGQFMAMLIRIMGVKRILEIGVFTGYSSTAMALALPPDGRLDACDVDEGFTAIARRYWEQAGVTHKIRLHLAPALETLVEFTSNGSRETYDLAFIDADKANYIHYYNYCIALLKPGGIVLVDNVLWGGDVANPSISDPDTEGIRKLNRRVHTDKRVEMCMLPVGDGLSIVRKL